MAYLVTFPNSNSNHFFVDNPIRVRLEANNNPVQSSYALIQVRQSNREIFSYRGSFYQGMCEFNISDSLKGLVDVDISNTVFIDYYANSVNSIIVRSTFYDADDNIQHQTNFNIYIHAGGVSNDLFRQLLQRPDRDIFGVKIYKKNSRKILTNRINIYVTMEELKSCPFSLWNYIMGNPACDLRIYCGTQTFSSPVSLTASPYTIANISLFDAFNNLMSNFTEEELANQKVFFELSDNLTGTGYSNVAQLFYLIKPQETKNSRILLFRNSWGVFEALEVNGMFTGEIENESNTIMVYDYDTDSYIEKEDERAGIRTVFRGETAFVNNDRLAFMRDFYSSKEVYLLEKNGKMEKVILTDKNQIFYQDDKKITSLPVSFYLAQTETKYTIIEDISAEPYILITPPEIHTQDEFATYQILVETNGSFNLESDADWLSFDPEHGIGNTIVNINVLDNTTLTQRQGTIRAILDQDSISSACNLIQEAKKVLSVNVDSIILSSENDYAETFSITSNRSWQLTGERLIFSPSEGVGNATIRVSSPVPTGREDYSSSFILQDKGSDMSVNIPYNIKGHVLIFEFNIKEMTLQYDATNYVITGFSNAKGLYIGASRLQYGDVLSAYYQVEGVDIRNGEYIPGDPGATGIYEFGIPFTFLTNNTDQIKDRVITLQEAYNLADADTMTILQLAEHEQPYLNINPQEFAFPNLLPVDPQDLNISSNINSHIEYDPQLIEFNPSSGEGDWISKVKAVKEHTGFEQRAILAIVKSDGITPQISLNITSKQAGKTPFMTPEHSTYDVFDTGGWVIIKGTGNFPNPHFIYGDNISEENLIIPDRYLVNGNEVYNHANIPSASHNQYQWEIEIEVTRIPSDNREYKLVITDAVYADQVTPVTITVNRMEMPANLSVTPTSLTFITAGGASIIQVTTNDRFEILDLMPEENYTGSLYWDNNNTALGKIFFNYSGNPEDGTIEVIAGENPLYESKSRAIVINGIVSRIQSQVDINQQAVTDQYFITDYDDFKELASRVNNATEHQGSRFPGGTPGYAGKTFTVPQNTIIDFGNDEFEGIGTIDDNNIRPFRGVLSFGEGSKITNFNIKRPSGSGPVYVSALLNIVQNANIKGVAIEGNINNEVSSDSIICSLIGLIYHDSGEDMTRVTACHSAVNINSTGGVAVIGINMGDLWIRDSWNSGNLTARGNSSVAFLAHNLNKARIEKVVNSGNISYDGDPAGRGICAGILGHSTEVLDNDKLVILNCANYGKISTNSTNTDYQSPENGCAAGILGVVENPDEMQLTLDKCLNTGVITAGVWGNIACIKETDMYCYFDSIKNGHSPGWPSYVYDGNGKITADLANGDALFPVEQWEDPWYYEGGFYPRVNAWFISDPAMILATRISPSPIVNRPLNGDLIDLVSGESAAITDPAAGYPFFVSDPADETRQCLRINAGKQSIFPTAPILRLAANGFYSNKLYEFYYYPLDNAGTQFIMTTTDDANGNFGFHFQKNSTQYQWGMIDNTTRLYRTFPVSDIALNQWHKVQISFKEELDTNPQVRQVTLNIDDGIYIETIDYTKSIDTERNCVFGSSAWNYFNSFPLHGLIKDFQVINLI